VCGPGRPGGETLDSLPGAVRSVICRIAAVSQGNFKFEDVAATKLLMHPMFSNSANWPRLEKGVKGQGQEARGRRARGFSSRGRGPLR
jgi:hypothetical protein